MKKTKQKQRRYEIRVNLDEKTYGKVLNQAQKLLLAPSSYIRMLVAKSMLVF